MNNLKDHAKSFAAYIGLDWADKKHYWSMLERRRQTIARRTETHPGSN
jgi:hypothetical protein